MKITMCTFKLKMKIDVDVIKYHIIILGKKIIDYFNNGKKRKALFFSILK